MAESFISAIAEKVLGKLGSLAYQELSLAWGVKNDIKELEQTLKIINAVLLDAEEQQGQNNRLRIWLEELKEVCYDAEDVLDEIEFEALRKQVVKSRGSMTLKVCNFFSSSKSLAFRFKMGHKIKEIRQRLDKIAKDKDAFNLTEKIENKYQSSKERETYSYVYAQDVIGRDKDKENIIKLLMSTSDSVQISVIPIVGIGGLGKTTVAKMVYNDKKVEEYFELRMWICVTDEFNTKKLISDIITSATGQNYSNMKIEQLQGILRDILYGKRYLLVMDDVWNEDLELWIELRNLLMGGINVGKIIVTTRSQRVASIMGTVSAYNLGGLSLKECLSLFVKCAFREGEENRHPNLIKIGEEIVKKCEGIPLAIRTLGSLLYLSTDEKEWKNVRDNELWELEQKENKILNALKLSYDRLPPYLKQCFAYCSIFAKGQTFSDIALIHFWMAQGLLKSDDQNKDLEEIALRYFKALMSRYFFHDIEQFYDQNFYNFKIHDLIQDLAMSLMKSECLVVKTESQVCLKTTRHLAFAIVKPKIDLPSFLFDSCHIRTILFPYQSIGPSQSFLESIISKCQFLRALNLQDSNIEIVPKGIGNLKHLRYLNISQNPKIKILPNSICKLYNLQTLFLDECVELKELPKDVRYLKSMRLLSLTVKQNYLPKNGIGCLNSLSTLQISNCRNLEYLFEDIGVLGVLQSLIIKNCPSLMALPHGIKCLRLLETLILSNCEKLNLNLSMGSEEEDNHQDLNGKRPHLRVLDVVGLQQLEKLPKWILQGSANTLQTLLIRNCSNFVVLPEPIQNLQSLQSLLIWACPKLSSLPVDMPCLTTLRKLDIKDCPALTERCKPETGEDWSKITHVSNIFLDGKKIK